MLTLEVDELKKTRLDSNSSIKSRLLVLLVVAAVGGKYEANVFFITIPTNLLLLFSLQRKNNITYEPFPPEIKLCRLDRTKGGKADDNVRLVVLNNLL